jgi:hypothetical protein
MNDYIPMMEENQTNILPVHVLQTLQLLETTFASLASSPTTSNTNTSTTNHYKSYTNKSTFGNREENTTRLNTQSGGQYKKKPTNPVPPDTTPEKWGATQKFKTTQMVTKEGVEKDINTIRVLLNKLSNKNFTTQKDLILQEISMIDIDKIEDLQKIAQFIFQIASTNKFYAELYADLYVELIERFDIFTKILDEFILNYKDTIQHIDYIDPNVDYDKYCVYTKQNDQRKATAAFLIMLMKKGIVSHDTILGILSHFLNVLLEYIKQPNRTNEVDEITENVFVFVSLGKAELLNTELWKTDTFPTIQLFSKMKATGENKSLSNRAIFKFLDIVDSLK